MSLFYYSIRIAINSTELKRCNLFVYTFLGWIGAVAWSYLLSFCEFFVL